jgi:uncharacterized protein (TIGR00369 family)
MNFVELLRSGRMSRDFDHVVEQIPYYRYLGIEVRDTDEGLVSVMPFAEHLIGNPMLPAIHGGVTGAFLESAAIVNLLAEVETESVPKTITVTVDFLRSGRPTDTYAMGTLTRIGRRVASVRAEAWQEDRRNAIAAATLHFLIR